MSVNRGNRSKRRQASIVSASLLPQHDKVTVDLSSQQVPESRQEPLPNIPPAHDGMDNHSVPLTSPSSMNEHMTTTSVGMSKKILEEFDVNPDFQSPTYALPGGSPSVQRSTQRRGSLSIKEVVGIDLPPKEVCDLLLASYFASVNWFMMVFHETSFRAKFEALTSSRQARQDQHNELMLVLLVLAMGARHVSEQDMQARGLQYDLDSLQTTFLAKVADAFMTILDKGELEAVKICVLLSSCYLYHGKPNLGFIVLGTGVRCAQTMNLQLEAAWTGLSEIAREERKRVWWALWTYDRFAAAVFGRPCSIKNSEVDVSMVRNMNDTSSRHPAFNSVERGEDGSMHFVTIFSYQKLKFQLYQIASPILENTMFYKESSISKISEKVMNVHQRLVDWFARLPSELRLNPSNPVIPGPKDSIETVFSLQALALQLAYDNIQILLHKPMFSFHGTTPRHVANQDNRLSSDNNNSPVTDAMSGEYGTPNSIRDPTAISKLQCWKSAVRTSRLIYQEQILEKATKTHAVSYVGIHLFTSGMVLSMVALSRPLSSQAQDAKLSISHILQMMKRLENRTLLSRQSAKVLEAIVKVILSKEMNRIFGSDSTPSNDCNTRQAQPSNVTQAYSLPAANTYLGQGQETLLEDLEGDGDLNNMNQINERTRWSTSFGQFDPGTTDSRILGNTDFQEGMTNIQQVMTDILGDAPPWSMTTSGSTDNAVWEMPGQSWLWNSDSIQE